MSSFGLEVLTPETEPCLVRLPETVAAGEVDAWLAGGALVEIANWDEPDRPYGRAYSAATVDKTRTHAELRLHLGGGAGLYSLSAITVVEVESTVMAFSTRAGRLDEPGDRRAVHVTEIDREFLRVMRGIGIVDGCVFRSDEVTLPSGLGRSLKPLSGPAAFGEEMDLDGPVLSLAEAVLWQMTSLDRPVPAVEVERRSFVEYWENSPRRD